MDNKDPKIPQIQFGEHEITKILDDDGSTETTVMNYANNKLKRPIRHKFSMRVRVFSHDEALEKYGEFGKELAERPEMLDPTWQPKERSKDGDENGYFYVVKGYTILEY